MPTVPPVGYTFTVRENSLSAVCDSWSVALTVNVYVVVDAGLGVPVNAPVVEFRVIPAPLNTDVVSEYETVLSDVAVKVTPESAVLPVTELRVAPVDHVTPVETSKFVEETALAPFGLIICNSYVPFVPMLKVACTEVVEFLVTVCALVTAPVDVLIACTLTPL